MGVRVRSATLCPMLSSMNTSSTTQMLTGPIILLALIFSLMTPVVVSADDASDEFSLGVGLYRKARYGQAADTFADFLNQFPDHSRAPLARLYYGLSLHSMENYTAAHRELSRFVEENPQSPHLASARYRIGESSFYARNYQAAITELSAYLDRHKADKLTAWGQLFLAESYSRVRDYPASEKRLRELLDSTTDPRIVPEARFELALSLELQDRDKEAMTAFQKLADGEFGLFSARSLAHIGTLYFERSEFDQASKFYDQIVTRFPQEPIAISATLQSAAAQYSADNFAGALKRLQPVPDNHPRINEARVLRGLCLRQLGQLNDAREELKAAYVAAGSSPQAAEILFQRAELERLDDQKELAAQMFLDLADRWPDSAEAPDALFNAAEAQMEARQLDEARKLVGRLKSEYPEQAARPLVQLLAGRMLLIDNKPAEAVTVLTDAATSSDLTDAQQLLVRYHLIRALHRNEQYQDVITAFERDRDRFLKSATNGTAQAISLAAVSHLERKQYEEAARLATRYLDRETTDARRIDALATLAVACARQAKFPAGRPSLDELLDKHRDHPQTWRSVLLSAEAAWGQKDYATASSLYVLASRYPDDEKVQESGLAGLAWSRFELNDYESATTAFRSLARDFRESPHVSESEYMTGFCARESGNSDLAVDTFSALFDRLEPAVSKDNTIADAKWAFDAGIACARLQVTLDKVDLADALYDRITKAFPDRKNIDATWDEWAAAHYQSQNYERADEIHREIVARFPGSRFAPNARLSLAESAMVAGELESALADFRILDDDAATPDEVREIALTNMVDILSASRKWDDVLALSERFATQFTTSDSGDQVSLFRAEALLNTEQYVDAQAIVDRLRSGLQDGSIESAKWADRVWVLAAEVALAQKLYGQVDDIEAELLNRSPDSPFQFQLNMVQGLRWKNQAPPDFAKSRDYLARVIQDDVSRGTKTAAKCQFLIAETYLLQQDTKTALREYLRVYINYAYDDWRAPALFQAALCEEELGNLPAARKSLNDVISEFPGTDMATRAEARLAEMADSP